MQNMSPGHGRRPDRGRAQGPNPLGRAIGYLNHYRKLAFWAYAGLFLSLVACRKSATTWASPMSPRARGWIGWCSRACRRVWKALPARSRALVEKASEARHAWIATLTPALTHKQQAAIITAECLQLCYD